MTTLIETYVIESQGVTVSRLIWNRFRKPMPGLVDRVYDMNRGLAALPVELPVGTTVMIPIDTPRPSVGTRRKPVSLWD